MTFSFLGFDYRRVKTRRGVWGVRVTPRMKARTALLQKLKDVFHRHQSQPVDRVIYLINPILRGWANYFRVGNSSECFGYIKDNVEKKIRRHLMHARNVVASAGTGGVEPGFMKLLDCTTIMGFDITGLDSAAG